MGAFARLQLALLDADDATVNLIFSAFAPAAPGVRPLSKRRMAKAMKLALALLDPDRISPVSASSGKGRTRLRPCKSGK